MLTIYNAAGNSPRTPAGIGDTNFSLKYNFLTEREGSRLPAMAIALDIELPTGDTKNQLGSGLADYYYAFRRNMTFDFGIVAGKYAASPRAGVQLGISIDF